MDEPISDALNAMPLANIREDGSLPDERLRHPRDLRDTYTRFKTDDRLNSHNRAMCQALRDGEPPYIQQDLIEAGQPDTTNVNWGGMDQKTERAKAPYYKLIHGTDTMLAVKTTFGSEDERPQWEQVMADEISKMLRRWPKFPYVTERLADKHVFEGLGVCYWPDDDVDWRIAAGGLGQFYFERQTAATEEDQEIVCVYEDYSLSRFAQHLKNPEKFAKKGWNIKAVQEAIRKAVPRTTIYQDWERLMEEVKNNDLSTGSKLPKVKIIHGFVKEFDGTVSHYMTTEDSVTQSEEWIYRNRNNRFKNMSEALILFPYSMGTNTLIHGLRGLGYKIYPHEQQRDRTICRAVDKMFEATSTMLQAETEEALANVELAYFGNLAVLPPGVKYVPVVPPNLEEGVLPIINLMDTMIGERTAGYSNEGVFDGDQRKTKFEVAAHLDQSASLTDTSIDFFYTPWERVLQQIVRRIIRKGYLDDEPGGAEVADLRKRIENRGVPIEAFHRIDHLETRAVRVIGSGSAAAKTMALDRLGALYPRMDDYGKANYNRDVAVDIVGATNADRYFTVTPSERTTVDTQIAIIQNFEILEGHDIPVMPSDRHLAHAREHIKPLVEMYQLVKSNQADIAEAATSHARLYAHCTQHVEYIEGDEASMQEADAMRQMLQRIGEIIANGLKEAEAREEKAAEEEQMTQEQQQPPLSPEDAAAFGKAQAEMQVRETQARIDQQIKIDNAALDRQIRLEKAQTDNATADAKAAAEIRRKDEMHKAEMHKAEMAKKEQKDTDE